MYTNQVHCINIKCNVWHCSYVTTLHGRFTCNQIKVSIFGVHFFGAFSPCLKSGQNRTLKKSNKINQSEKIGALRAIQHFSRRRRGRVKWEGKSSSWFRYRFPHRSSKSLTEPKGCVTSYRSLLSLKKKQNLTLTWFDFIFSFNIYVKLIFLNTCGFFFICAFLHTWKSDSITLNDSQRPLEQSVDIAFGKHQPPGRFGQICRNMWPTGLQSPSLVALNPWSALKKMTINHLDCFLKKM